MGCWPLASIRNSQPNSGYGVGYKIKSIHFLENTVVVPHLRLCSRPTSSESISSLGRRCPGVFAKLMHVLRHSACRCHRTEYYLLCFSPFFVLAFLCFFSRLQFLALVYSLNNFVVTRGQSILVCDALQNDTACYIVHGILIPVSGKDHDANANSRRDIYRYLRYSHAWSPHVHISNFNAETWCYTARAARWRYQQQVRKSTLR